MTLKSLGEWKIISAKVVGSQIIRRPEYRFKSHGEYKSSFTLHAKQKCPFTRLEKKCRAISTPPPPPSADSMEQHKEVTERTMRRMIRKQKWSFWVFERESDLPLLAFRIWFSPFLLLLFLFFLLQLLTYFWAFFRFIETGKVYHGITKRSEANFGQRWWRQKWNKDQRSWR